MSRRLVSYSDLTEDAPQPPPAQDSTQPECSYAPQTAPRHGSSNGKRKRVKADQLQRKRQAPRGTGPLHWDDPSYEPSSSTLGSWKEEAVQLGETIANGVEDEGEDEEFYDATDGEESLHKGSVGDAEEGKGEYAEWKYDEYAEPYDRTHRHYSGSHPDDYDQTNDHEKALSYAEDDDNHYYEDQREAFDSNSEDSLPNFAIPDVTEFNRNWAARHPSSPTTPSATLPSAPPAQTRPPIEVGGGGRSLSHSEIWSDTVITSAFNSALYQYCELHQLPWTGARTESALWNDAPLHSSLLAGQIREDAQQILAQQRDQSFNINSVKGKKKSGKKVNGEQTLSNKAESLDERRGKPIVTVVPSAHLEGNTAWKKAVKTVQTTPNSIGLPTSEEEVKAEKKVDGEMGQEEQNKLHAYWTAGYYAGLAAAASTSTNGGAEEQIHG